MEWLDKPPDEWPESAHIFYGLVKVITDRRLVKEAVALSCDEGSTLCEK